jgi:glycosyltransferase involved in cell wall biosynthesis
VKKWLYWPWAEYRVLRDAAAVLFTSQEEMTLAAQSFWMYRCTPLVVNYGTAAPPDDTSRQRELFLETFPSLRGQRLILFLGRIHEKKGCDLLIEAVSALRASTPEPRLPWHLIMAGPVAENSYRRRLKDLIYRMGMTAAVTWTGMLTGDLKWGAFRAADVFILPSHQENFGVAVAEALACGLPVLISRRVNIWREIVADQAGFAEQDDQEGTRRLLMQWMSLDEATRCRFRGNARRCFSERFEIGAAATRIAEALERVA